jgi:hypothetical protein
MQGTMEQARLNFKYHSRFKITETDCASIDVMDTGKEEFLSYGLCPLPRSAGMHKVETQNLLQTVFPHFLHTFFILFTLSLGPG